MGALNSKLKKGPNYSKPPLQREARSKPNYKRFIEVTPGFWHLRINFTVKSAGIGINIFNQMAVVNLEFGDFVAIDAVTLDEEAMQELADLTDNGVNLIGVITTHPFHSLGIRGFHAMYPSNENVQGGDGSRRYYGCPRHLREIKEDSKGNTIHWHGDLEDNRVRKVFEPDLIMSIPDGAQFNDPKPASWNHLSSVVVLHQSSKTLYAEEIMTFIDNVNKMGLVVSLTKNFSGLKSQQMRLHSAWKLLDDPIAFKKWIFTILNEWDFDHLCTAHTGNCFNHAKRLMREVMNEMDADLMKLNCERLKGKSSDDSLFNEDDTWASDENRCECG